MLRQSGRPTAHPDITELKETLKEKFDDIDLFCATVRNPWDWRHSWYHFVKRRDFGSESEICNSMSFKNHLYWLEEHIDDPEAFADGRIFVKKQTEYIDERVKIMKLENIKEDFLNLFGFEFGNWHQNKSNDIDYRTSYDQETIDIVTRLYREDIEAFGYDFE